MNKFTKIVIASCFLFSVPTIPGVINPSNTSLEVSAMDLYKDPGGFADLHWGETLADIQDSHETKFIGYQTGSAAYYILIPDAHGSVYFEGPVVVRGVFLDNKLSSIIIPFSKEMFSKRLAGMTELYGSPNILASGCYSWEGPLSLIILTQGKNDGLIALAEKKTK